jgi:hypothetical protein
MQWDNARRRERVPGGRVERDTESGLMFIGAAEIRPLLEFLEARGAGAVSRAARLAIARERSDGLIATSRFRTAFRDVPSDALEALCGTARQGFGSSDARTLRNVARSELARRQDE